MQLHYLKVEFVSFTHFDHKFHIMQPSVLYGLHVTLLVHMQCQTDVEKSF